MATDDDVARRIADLGDRLVKCTIGCKGIACDQARGVIPRCLVYEQRNPEQPRVVVIGLNPGRSREAEHRVYREADSSYRGILNWWNHAGSQHRYYKRLRALLDSLGFDGSILWTELVKCESVPDIPLPTQTLRTCTGNYLRDEINAVGGSCTLFAVGREAFNATAYLFHDHAVIGIPHPTGARGHFDWLLAAPESVKETVTKALESSAAAWLTSQPPTLR